MSSSYEAIWDKIDEYEHLCKQYNETPVRSPDGYADYDSKHADALKAQHLAKKDLQTYTSIL